MSATTSIGSAPEVENFMLDYPVVSIAYCVRCKWMLRAAWYQQEILQTFGSKQDDISTEAAGGLPKTLVNSVLLRPSLVPGTFTIAVKVHRGKNWVVIWDRKLNGGFPDSKVVKQKIRDLVRPGMKMSHLDKPGTGTLLSGTRTEGPTEGSSQSANQNRVVEGEEPAPLARAKTLTEECVECTRMWEG